MTDRPVTARPADVSDPAALVKALYEILSGPASAPRDWPRLRTFYVPGARLMPVHRDPDGTPRIDVFDIDAYIASRTPLLARADFYEVELSRRETRLGRVAHVLSLYESRRSPTAPAFARGVNSFQLFFDDRRWWITSATWDIDHAAQLLSSEYLGTL